MGQDYFSQGPTDMFSDEPPLTIEPALTHHPLMIALTSQVPEKDVL